MSNNENINLRRYEFKFFCNIWNLRSIDQKEDQENHIFRVGNVFLKGKDFP